MKKIFITFFTFVFLSCSNKNGLEIEILNNELISYSFDSKKDTINIINYKITNKSNDIYYINTMIEDDKLQKLTKGIYKNGLTLRVFDNVSKEIEYKTIPIYDHSHTPPNVDSIYYNISTKRMILNSKRLGYKELKRFDYSKGGYSNFFIHPNETIYFEYYINLTDTISNDNFRGGYANLKKRVNYHARLSIASDSSNYKNDLPRDILKTIQANNAKVYHGIIESKNKVPVKVLE